MQAGRRARPRLKLIWLSLAEIVSRLRVARRIAVATDYDGTLAPIAPHPDQAALPPRAREALVTLARAPGVHVAVLSGRGVADLRRQVDVPGIHLVGATGLETLDPEGRLERHVPPGSGLPRDLAPHLEEWCRGYPGTWVEDKGPSLAVHYRALTPRLRAGFARGVRERLAAGTNGVRVVPGRKVFEVMPALDRDKGAALEEWLGSLDSPLAFFFGDDQVDEPVHEAVRRRGGVAVTVGRRVSCAEYVLPDPAQVTWFLEWLAREWQESAPRG